MASLAVAARVEAEAATLSIADWTASTLCWRAIWTNSPEADSAAALTRTLCKSEETETVARL